MDRFETRVGVGQLLVIPTKRKWCTLPSGALRVEGSEAIYFNDPDGRPAAACQEPVTSAVRKHINQINTPELRASGVFPRLHLVEVPEALQSELRDTITGVANPRALDNAVQTFVKSFANEHPITKLFVATRLLWTETDGVYEINITELIRSALGRRLLVSHTLQLTRGVVQLSPLEVNANFEKWATQVWTFDVPDSARRAIVQLSSPELAPLANDQMRNCLKFSPKQKQRWSSFKDNQLKRKAWSAAVADNLGISRLKVVRALDGIKTIHPTSTQATTRIPPCIQQYMDGTKHMDNPSRCTLSTIFARVRGLTDIDGILSAFALSQPDHSMRSLRLSMKHDETRGSNFMPSCTTCQDPKRQGFTCPAKSTAACAKQLGVKQVALNQTPADMMAGIKITGGSPALKKRRLNSTVESPAEGCEQAGNEYKGLVSRK
jgi:hypothetical protein